MTSQPSPSRRSFLQGSVSAAAAAGVLAASGARSSRADDDKGAGDTKPPPKPGATGTPVEKAKLRKAVKYGMIGAGNSIEEKFALIKKLGYEGVEMDSPSGVNREEAVKAKEKTGIEIHGVV